MSIPCSPTRAKVRKALDFHFTRRSVKDFPKRRLEMIERQIRQHAKMLLSADHQG